jgi:hypothetical protein
MDGGNLRDVTADVDVGVPQGRSLPLVRCVCGYQFSESEGTIEPMALHARAVAQPCCGRRFVFVQTITVFEVV